MAKTITATFRITQQGDGLVDSDVFQVVNNAGQAAQVFPNVAIGTTFFGNGSSNGLILVPPKSVSGQPTNSNVGKTLVGNAGDVGIPLDPSSPIIASTTLLGLTYGGPESAFAVYF